MRSIERSQNCRGKLPYFGHLNNSGRHAWDSALSFGVARKPGLIEPSLLYRYSLIYSSGSAVAICKVTYRRDEVSFGLKARRNIPQGSYIKETCSSMSKDVVLKPAPSIIESTAGQLGKRGPRFILGPFRFVNHCCKPNAQH